MTLGPLYIHEEGRNGKGVGKQLKQGDTQLEQGGRQPRQIRSWSTAISEFWTGPKLGWSVFARVKESNGQHIVYLSLAETMRVLNPLK